MNALQLLLCGILLLSRGSVRSAAENAVPTLESSVDVTNKCWIFTHLSKSGGSTMKGILKNRFSQRFVIYDEPEWKKGDSFVQLFAQTLVAGDKWDVVAGGNTEALRASSAADQKCQWFTMFRHPLTRMVSAYYYCKTNPKDTLCATIILNAKNTDLATFAKHWGNFALRQFAHGLVKIDDVMEYSRSNAMREGLPPKIKTVEQIPAWYMLKMYLEDKAKTSEYVKIPDGAMYDMLLPVQDLIRDHYTVGILEEFNTSLTLFDAALSMPGVDWHKQYARSGKNNVDRTYTREVEETLTEAWTDSEIKKYMQLDLVLYEHAVDVFRQQKRAYGIE